jgi:glycosyltransferase involved in cell wall biosynthesis
MTVLFVGTFLSEKTGTKAVAEKLAAQFEAEGRLRPILASRHHSLLFRAVDIFWATLFGRFEVANIDVFSGKAFHFAWLAGHLLHWRKKPFLLTLRGGRLAEFSEDAPLRIHSLFSKAVRVQTPSLFLQEHFKKQGWAVKYLPNPLALSQFKPSAPSVERKAQTLLWVRAFSEIYHPEIPVQVLGLLLVDFPEATLTMVGPDKGLLNKTKKLIAELGIAEKVQIVGAVPNDDLPIYYQTHTVYLNTTAYESFGVAVAEAAACGLPVVSSNVGEIPYLWRDGEEILLAEQFNAEAFAAQVRRVFEQPLFAKALGEKAARRAQEFDFQTIKEKWEGILKSLPEHKP